MADPVIVITISVILAILSAGLGLTIQIPYLEYGLPMLVLLIGSGTYTLQTKGIQGIAEDFATSIFVGVTTTFLTLLIMQGEKRK
jgi:hypothetical protein